MCENTLTNASWTASSASPESRRYWYAIRDALRCSSPTSPPNRSRASSISPRSTSPRISTASRESSDGGAAGRRAEVDPGADAPGTVAESAAVRTSTVIRALRFVSAGVYSLPYPPELLTHGSAQVYDPKILPMLLGRHTLGVVE